MYNMSTFSNRCKPTTRTGRPTPELSQANSSKMDKPKIAVNELYHLDESVGTSTMLPSVFNRVANQPQQSVSFQHTSNHLSVPMRSQSRSTTNSISFPVMSSNSLHPSASTLSVKRAPTPPPPYAENICSKENADVNTTSAPSRSRSRNSSASSWIKRVVSRSSSRASHRKQYDQIPMSEEERAEAEVIRAHRAERALAEWNRVNDALKNAGF